MTRAWGREEDPELAAARILDAAGRAFAERGVSAAGMGEIAAFAGCSRGTLYRYFPSRHRLHVAYVDRAARRIAERVRAETRGVPERRARLAEAVLVALRAVREDPGTAAWFEPGASGMAARMSRSSEVIEALTAGFVSELLGAARQAEGRLLEGWLVRVIVALLSMPGETAAEERAWVERFVAEPGARALRGLGAPRDRRGRASPGGAPGRPRHRPRPRGRRR